MPRPDPQPRVFGYLFCASDYAKASGLALIHKSKQAHVRERALMEATEHAADLTARRAAWECACAWDGISHEALSAIFSQDNPYARRLRAVDDGSQGLR